MKSLLVLEARRATARRLPRVIVGVLALLVGVAGVLVFVNTDEADEYTLERIDATVAALRAECLVKGGAFDSDAGGPSMAEQCDELAESARSDLEDKVALAANTDEVVAGMTPMGIMFGFLVGASLLGAEWRAGTVTTQLTWESRRLRVLGAKLATAGVLWGVAATALLALLVAALWPTVMAKGITSGLDVGALAGALVRAGVGAAAAAVAGGALATVGRNTAAALGAGFAYLAVIERIIATLRPTWVSWLMGENLAVYVTGSTGEAGYAFHRTLTDAALTLGVYVAVMVAVAAVLFDRRDVAGAG